MLTDLQKKYLVESILSFTEILNETQIRMLHFRLDDIIQYGPGAVQVMYNVVHDLMMDNES